MHFRLSLVASFLAAALSAQAPVPHAVQPTATPNKWFAKVHESVHVGEGETHAIGRFPFHNPNNAEIEWREFSASCACSHMEFMVGDRRYWLKPKPRELVQLVTKTQGQEPVRVPVEFIPVHAGEDGTVEVHIELTNGAVKKSVYVDIHSNDAEFPQMRLQVEADRADSLVVTPPEVELGTIPPGEVREFAVEVHSPGRKDFEMSPPEKLPPGVHVECSKVTNNGVSVWTIRGTYGPYDAGKGGVAQLKFATNLKEQPSVSLRVAGVVAPLVEVSPGFVTLGRIDPAGERRAQVRFHATDGTDLETTSVSLANLSPQAAKVETKVTKDGKDVLVEIVVPAGASAGLLRGDLLVEVNHPKVKPFKVLFNGYVR